MVVALLVNVTLKSADAVQLFVKDIAELYAFVRSSEAQTLTYEIHVSRDDKTKLTILERYVSDEALDKIHSKSAPFVEFVDRLQRGFDYVSDVKVERLSEPDEAVQLNVSVAASSSEKGVLVFCGSRAGAKPQYVAEAEALGREMSKRGLFLVYGAGTVGVMGALAKSFLSAAGSGAVIKSVIPRALAPKEISGEMIGQVILTDTMAERKTVLLANAKRVIALPGGLGTVRGPDPPAAGSHQSQDWRAQRGALL